MEDKDVRRNNLEKLATLLERVVPPPEFDMGAFIAVDSSLENERRAAYIEMPRSEYQPITFYPNSVDESVYSWCGTVACAAGHGPMAGIKGLPNESWAMYTARSFTGGDSDMFSYLFGADWVYADNTPKGAAARIRRHLAEGLPFQDLNYAVVFVEDDITDVDELINFLVRTDRDDLTDEQKVAHDELFDYRRYLVEDTQPRSELI